MNDNEVRGLLHPKEGPYFALALLATLPFALIIAALTIGSFGLFLILIAGAVFLIWFTSNLFRAMLLSHAAKVTDDNFPQIHALVEDIKAQLAYKKRVEVFIVEEGSFNSLLISLFNIKVIQLNSEILADGVSEQEIKFIIARFIGGLRAKCYRLTLLQSLISMSEKFLVLNIFLYPYERAVVLSGDRIGLHVIDGDVTSAVIAMNRLCVGVHCGRMLNIRAMLHQREEIRGLFGFLARIFSTHPSMPVRYHEFLTYAKERHPEKWRELAHLIPPAPAIPVRQDVRPTVAATQRYAS